MNIPPEYLNQIVTGDSRDLSKRLPDESIDFIFTDPPYPREYLYTFEWLAEEAARILKLGGSLITLSGGLHFDAVFTSLSKTLDYYWVGGMPSTAGNSGTTQVHARQIMAWAKPFLWFSKGAVERHPYVFDYLRFPVEKEYHEWGQPTAWFRYYLEKLSPGIVFDPFCGGGAVPVACKQLGLTYISFEIDPLTAQRARERVANTQVPLFVLQPTQLEMLDTTNEK